MSKDNYNLPTEGAPSGALPPLHNEPSQFDQVVDGLDKESTRVLVKLLDQFGLDHKDPLVTGIHILLEAKASSAAACLAAHAAATAAERIDAATARVGKVIFDQTSAAGKDLNHAISRTIQGQMQGASISLTKTISTAANRGAQALQAAAVSLDKLGRQKGDEFVEWWRVAATHAIDAHAQLAIRRAWLWALSVIVLSIILGAGIGVGGAWHFRHPTPSDLHIYPLPDHTYVEVFPGNTRVNPYAYCPQNHLCLQVFPNAQ